MGMKKKMRWRKYVFRFYSVKLKKKNEMKKKKFCNVLQVVKLKKIE